MDERLGALADALGGVFSTADAARCDVSQDAVETMVRRGEVVRVRRAAYVLTPRYVDRPPSEQFRLRARAIIRTCAPGAALSHHAALAVYGVAIYGVPLQQVDLVAPVRGAKRRSGVRIHPRGDLGVVQVGVVPVVPLAVAVAQTAAAFGSVAGVCAADDALHRGLLTAERLSASVRSLPAQQRARVSRALVRANGSCESVGETRARLLLVDLGYSVELQVDIWDARGFVGRVDLLVEGDLVVEFDGIVKYGGADGVAVLVAEKQRESRLTAAGYGVVRLLWSDLADPGEVAQRVRHALSALRRRRAG
jgi:hypothetical protein